MNTASTKEYQFKETILIQVKKRHSCEGCFFIDITDKRKNYFPCCECIENGKHKYPCGGPLIFIVKPN
jgi:hypothetical protein